MFNHGLRKTLEDLARSIPGELGGYGEDGRLWARGARLQARVEGLARELAGPAFELTVDKPPAEGADVNSRQFGASNGQVVFAFRQFLTALRLYYTARVREPSSEALLGMLNTACLHAELAVSRWVGEAFDHEAAGQARREEKEAAAWIADGHLRLGKLRDGLIALIRRESPGRSATQGLL